MEDSKEQSCREPQYLGCDRCLQHHKAHTLPCCRLT